MKTSSRSPRALSPRLSILLAAALAVPTLCAGPASAQQSKGQAGAFSFEAKQITTPGGSLRLEGNVRLYTPANASPSIDIAAPLVTGDSYKPRRVRAQGGVSFKYSGVRVASEDDKKKGETDVTVNIEAKSREVFLDTVPQNGRRTLTLTGDISGFYEVDGQRTTLGGQKAVISFGDSPGDVQGSFEGGGQPFALTLPKQKFGSGVDLGTVTLNAAKAAIDQKANTAQLEGGAKLTSSGPGKLLVSAAAFDATLAAQAGSSAKQLQKLTSRGRVKLSLALPPESIGPAAPGAKDASYPLTASIATIKLVQRKDTGSESLPEPEATAPASGKGAASTSAPAKPKTALVPVSIEISADSAVVEPSTQTLTLSGNVSGTYVLREVLDESRSATSTSPGAPGASQSSDKVPMSLDLKIEGAPVQIELPSFNLEL